MKILNLYAGLGGNRTLWNEISTCDITAVENNSTIAEIYYKRFPDDQVLIGDVFEFLRDKNNHLNEFDFIWASPPCQSHSHMQIFTKNDRTAKIPRLDETLGLALWLNRHFEGAFVVENVVPWYGVINHKKLKFVIIQRHLFISNFHIPRRHDQKKGNNQHGEIGGIMRESRNELMEKYCLPEWILDDLKGVHDKDQIIRNCVEPKIGEYILKQFLAGPGPTLQDYL